MLPSKVWFAYLIELSKPLGNDRHKARYYLGIARDWHSRFKQHIKGKGAKMLAFATSKGIAIGIVRVWKFASYRAAREFELWAKTSVKNHRRLLAIPSTPHWKAG